MSNRTIQNLSKKDTKESNSNESENAVKDQPQSQIVNDVKQPENRSFCGQRRSERCWRFFGDFASTFTREWMRDTIRIALREFIRDLFLKNIFPAMGGPSSTMGAVATTIASLNELFGRNKTAPADVNSKSLYQLFNGTVKGSQMGRSLFEKRAEIANLFEK